MQPQRKAAAAVLFSLYLLGRRYPQMSGDRGEGGQRCPRCGSECRNLQLGGTCYSARRYRPRLRTHPGIAVRLRATAKLNGLDHLHIHEAAVLNQNGQGSLKRFRGELRINEGMNFI